MTCESCANKTHHGQGSQKMHAMGFTGCKKAPAHEYFSPVVERKCGDFVRAAK